MSLEIGSTIGDYQVIGILGAGGMGKVYKVKNVISDRVEAMKVLLPNLASEAELADRFIREIKVQASLEHPHIAALHTALRVENQLLMLMEFVEGETLEQKLQNGPLPVAEALEYAGQALSALGYAHGHGLIHRDIKPANMMLTPAGVIKLMDFGIAKAANDRRLTMTGFTMGSLYYMSPEQIQGVSTLDARSDLYSLGVSLYELVTGKRPFEGDSQFSIMSAHLEKTPVPPITLDPKLPEALNEIILMSLDKDPAKRFQSAEAFRAALQTVLPAKAAAAPVAAPPQAEVPAPAPQQEFRLIEPTVQKSSSGHRGLWMAAGGIAAVLAIVAVVQFGPWKSTSASRAPAPPAQVTPAPVTASPAPASLPPVSATTPPRQPPAADPAAETNAPVHQRIPAPARAEPRRTQTEARKPVQTAAPVATPPPVTPPAQQPVASQAAAPPPQNDAARRAELQQVREQLAMLAARANTCSDGLNSLARSQAASGMTLRGDMTEAANLMNTYMTGARQALDAGDAAASRSLMEKAERQVERIETFLGR